MNNEENEQITSNEPEDEDTTPICQHENTHVLTLGIWGTCEVTAVFCKDCGERLGEEHWDC
ncbi:hypothetical protein [Capnocytophaga sp.]|uniref:hypothetical protein n=1 Tax=Capnocytophaga sp. TaxID=44737 RepID=UPI0026DC8712|nr:hypothetical protein [Capnocytophaga sp.]MDO5106238.1 hypothetical protein [Capnocytophaga sp.]